MSMRDRRGERRLWVGEGARMVKMARRMMIRKGTLMNVSRSDDVDGG